MRKGYLTDNNFHPPRTSNSFRNFNMSQDDVKSSLPIELNQRSTRKDISIDSKVGYKSKKKLNKSRAKKLNNSFMPQTYKDYDNVSLF